MSTCTSIRRRADRSIYRVLVTLTLILTLTGCASLSQTEPPDTAASHGLEIAFQAANAWDYAQSVAAARRPNCYEETDPFTRRIIGSHPSSGAVGAMWAAQAGAHYLVTTWLDREVDATGANGWRVARGIWHAVTLGNALRNVVHNEQIGIQPFGGIDCERPIVCGRGPCRGRPQ